MANSIKNEITDIFTPFKKLSYYNNFFNLIYQNVTFPIPWKVKLYFFAFVIDVFYKIPFVFAPKTELSQTLLLNYIFLLKLPADSKPLIVNIYTQTFIFYYLMYRISYASDFSILPYNLIIKNNTNCFLTPFYKKKNIVNYFKKIGFILLNIFQTFILASG